jgi:ESCRT-I complex subunit TSG101
VPAYLAQTYYKPPPPLPAPVPAPAPPASQIAPTPTPNFLDADEAPTWTPAPPSGTPARPPNPELLALHANVHAKFSSELASLQHALALDAERLRAHQTDLLAGAPAVRDEMARLGAVRDVCRTVAGRMQGAVDAAERNVEEMRRKGEPSVDELVCATTIVHNQ